MAKATDFKSEIARLRELESGLEQSVVKFQQLRDLSHRISNFKFIDQEQNWVGEARSLLALGDVKRQIAMVMDREFNHKGLVYAAQVAKLEVVRQEAERSAARAGAAAKTSARAPTPPDEASYRKKRKVVMAGALVCYEGGANECQTHSDVEGMVRAEMGMGMLLEMDERFEEAAAVLEKTVRVCEKAGDSFRAQTLRAQELYSALASTVDRFAFRKKNLLKATNDFDKDLAGVKRAFDFHDKDGSGEMDVSEFANFAARLGTYPPLKDEEVEEALVQIDKSRDGSISFDEFWVWWASADLKLALPGVNAGDAVEAGDRE